MAKQEDIASKQKFAFSGRVAGEKRYDDFVKKLEEYQQIWKNQPAGSKTFSPNDCWKYAAAHFPPLNGAPHEVADLDKLPPIPPSLDEIPAVDSWDDDAPPAEKYVPAPPEPDDQPSFDGSDIDVADLLDDVPAATPPAPAKPPEPTAPAPLAPEPPPKSAKKPRKPPRRNERPTEDEDPNDIAGDPERPDYSDLRKLTKEERELAIFERLHKTVPKDKKAKPVEIIAWVAENIDEPPDELHPGDVPCRTALSILRTTKYSTKARDNFFDKHWVRLLPSKDDMGNTGASADDHQTQTDLMDRFEQNYFDRKDAAGENGDAERNGSDSP